MREVRWNTSVHHLEGKTGELEFYIPATTELRTSGVHRMYRWKISVMVSV